MSSVYRTYVLCRRSCSILVAVDFFVPFEARVSLHAVYAAVAAKTLSELQDGATVNKIVEGDIMLSFANSERATVLIVSKSGQFRLHEFGLRICNMVENDQECRKLLDSGKHDNTTFSRILRPYILFEFLPFYFHLVPDLAGPISVRPEERDIGEKIALFCDGKRTIGEILQLSTYCRIAGFFEDPCSWERWNALFEGKERIVVDISARSRYKRIGRLPYRIPPIVANTITSRNKSNANSNDTDPVFLNDVADLLTFLIQYSKGLIVTHTDPPSSPAEETDPLLSSSFSTPDYSGGSINRNSFLQIRSHVHPYDILRAGSDIDYNSCSDSLRRPVYPGVVAMVVDMVDGHSTLRGIYMRLPLPKYLVKEITESLLSRNEIDRLVIYPSFGSKDGWQHCECEWSGYLSGCISLEHVCLFTGLSFESVLRDVRKDKSIVLERLSWLGE